MRYSIDQQRVEVSLMRVGVTVGVIEVVSPSADSVSR
jgi:hypothetical protein